MSIEDFPSLPSEPAKKPLCEAPGDAGSNKKKRASNKKKPTPRKAELGHHKRAKSAKVHIDPNKKTPDTTKGRNYKSGFDIRACEMRFAELYMRGATYANSYKETHETVGLKEASILARAQRLMKTERVKKYLEKIRGDNAPGININVKAGVGDTSAVLQLMEAFKEFNGDVIVNEQTQQRKLELCIMYSMVKGQYNWATAAIKEQSELAGLKIDRKEVRVGSFGDMTPKELKDAREDYRRQLIDMGYDQEQLSWAIEKNLPDNS